MWIHSVLLRNSAEDGCTDGDALLSLTVREPALTTIAKLSGDIDDYVPAHRSLSVDYNPEISIPDPVRFKILRRQAAAVTATPRIPSAEVNRKRDGNKSNIKSRRFIGGKNLRRSCYGRFCSWQGEIPDAPRRDRSGPDFQNFTKIKRFEG